MSQISPPIPQEACPQARTAVILCTCSGMIAEKIDWSVVQDRLATHPARPWFKVDELSCSADHLDQLVEWLESVRPDRLVVAACSPREHEGTFRGLMVRAGLNPYLMQMVNVREHVAWVTADPVLATDKATRLLSAALYRVRQQVSLYDRQVPMCADVAVIGAGPAGMQAALTLARAGRRVTLIERAPFIGGMPVRLEELFPHMECGPCLLEPVMGDILHGPESEHITLLTLSEVTAVKGGFGNWHLTVRRSPRFVNPELCIGCMECATVCPQRRQHPWNYSGQLAAVDAPFAGALPNLPHIDSAACLKLSGQTCDACTAQCPVEGALAFDDAAQVTDIHVGAIIVATGAVEKQDMPPLFAGLPDVHTASTFERLVAMNGPTGGEIFKADGSVPRSLAIVHCAGSLDASDTPYCSGTCCRNALKLAHVAHGKADGIHVTRLVREQVVPGTGACRQMDHDHSQAVRYTGLDGLRVEGTGAERQIVQTDTGDATAADMIVLMRPLIPSAGTQSVCKVLDLAGDDAGFMAPLHAITGACATPMKGIYLAGACRGPCDVREAFDSGTASAGLALSDLVSGRDLTVSPQVAVVAQDLCAGCKTCLPLCPYRAISWSETAKVAQIEGMLCRGCGTCVAACPSGAITGCGFSREMLRAELQGVLS